ncbi:unnamed protein product [Diamesa tonsa]
MLSIKCIMLLILLLMIKTIQAMPSMNDLNGKDKCERITITSCNELQYNHTMMPNSAGHMNVIEADDMINSLGPLFETVSPCSRQLRFLICSSLFPFCSDEIARPVLACRSACEKVKLECWEDPVVRSLWPSFLDCDILPQPNKQELCMQMPATIIQDETIITNNSSDTAITNDVNENNNNKYQLNHQPSFWKKLTQSHQIYNKMQVSTLSTCPQNFTLNEKGNCAFKCGTDAFYTIHQKKVIETCILVFSVLCFIFTLFSLITFWTESTRFKFPERPVLFLTLCYNLLSICYLGKIFYQKSTLPGSDEFNDLDFVDRSGISSIKTNDLSVNQCSVNSQCLAYFIIMNYLIISASFWWLVFGLCWWLSTSKQWSAEALERKSGSFHVLAWLVPLASPIAALLFGAIKTNELTGMCTAPGFTEIPSFILLVSGAVFILLSAKSLKSLRSSWKNNKLSQVMSRILMFGTIFAIPATVAVVLMFFDNDYDLPACLPGEICSQPEKRFINISIFRYACQLIGGLMSGVWVWSKKTCLSCRKKIATVQYAPTNQSQQTTIENWNASNAMPTNKYLNSSYKHFNSLHKGLLNNNYHSHKKFISGVHRTDNGIIDWIPHHSRV